MSTIGFLNNLDINKFKKCKLKYYFYYSNIFKKAQL